MTRSILPARRIPLLTVVVVVATLAAIVVVLAATREAEAAFPGQNGRIAFTSDLVTLSNLTGDSEIFTSKPDGAGLKQITFNTTSEYSPSYSPNGARIAYEGYDGNDSEIFTIPASGGSAFNVTNNSMNDSSPAYSPNGQRIAYVSFDGHDYEVFTISASGGASFNVTNNATNDFQPSYSPNGTRIAYSGYDGPSAEIYTIPASGGTPFNVTNNATDEVDPSYSPNGQRIAYSAFDGSDYEIFTISDSGGAATNLTNVVDDDFQPVWSPDGTKIAFMSNDEIYTMNASDGSNQTNISDTNSSTIPAIENYPDWQPNTAPSITSARPAPGSGLRDRTPRIRAVVRDVQNDLAGSDIKLYVDGRAKPFSYNRATDDLAYTTGRLSFGMHTVRIVARDEMGLSSTRSWSFRVVR